MRHRLPPQRASRQEVPAQLAGRILHLDPDVMVLDKPAGLPVHAGPRGGPSLEDWLPALQMGKRHLPQPAHRLDTDTSGCLVLGRTKPALAELGRVFATGVAEKVYWAVLVGRPTAPEGIIDAPLRKVSSRAAGWRMEVHAEGLPAQTAWRVLGAADGLSWVEFRPATGRTHQLRVHAAHAGCPILGDPVYGRAGGGLHLMARSLTLPLAKPIAAVAPVPGHMQEALAACGWRESAPPVHAGQENE